MDESKLIDMNRRFDEKLNELVSLKGQNTQFFTKRSYTQMIQKVKSSKCKVSNKKYEDYNRLRRFDVMIIGETEKLIVPVKEDNVIKSYVYKDEIFKILHDTHLAIGHGRRDIMKKKLNLLYKNITREMIVIYLKLCENCEKKRDISKKVLGNPILSKEINARCQVDLIDMQSQEDDRYKFILVYQDLLTKFVQLRLLKSKSSEEIAYVLLDIFTIFGAPSVLQSNNGREFSNKIVQAVCDKWPELKIIHGKPRHSYSQESVEQVNQDIKNMLSSWLEDNNTKKWSEGLRFVQLMKNRAPHNGIDCSPYEAMFGTELKVGLKSSSIPQEALININSEDLVNLFTV